MTSNEQPCYNHSMPVDPPSTLKAPRGITVAEAAAALRYSPATIRRMIAAGELIAWRPRGPRGRRILIDEVSLAALQSTLITTARAAAAPTQQALIQGALF